MIDVKEESYEIVINHRCFLHLDIMWSFEEKEKKKEKFYVENIVI